MRLATSASANSHRQAAGEEGSDGRLAGFRDAHDDNDGRQRVDRLARRPERLEQQVGLTTNGTRQELLGKQLQQTVGAKGRGEALDCASAGGPTIDGELSARKPGFDGLMEEVF